VLIWPDLPQQQLGDPGQQQQQEQQQKQQLVVNFISSLTRLTGLCLDASVFPDRAADRNRCLQQVSKLTGLRTLSLAISIGQLQGQLGR
jgi:hypothetical protein